MKADFGAGISPLLMTGNLTMRMKRKRATLRHIGCGEFRRLRGGMLISFRDLPSLDFCMSVQDNSDERIAIVVSTMAYFMLKAFKQTFYCFINSDA